MRLLCSFSTHIIWDSGNSRWKRYCHTWESVEINILFYGLYCVEFCLAQISILKRCNSEISKARFSSVGKPSPNPHLNLKKSQLQHMNLEHCLTLKIDSSLQSTLKRRARALIKFTRSVTCFKTIFKYSEIALLASAYRWRTQGTEMIYGARLFTRGVKPDFTEHRRGAVYA